MVVYYETKKELKENIGKPLKYRETSLFGPENKSNGVFALAIGLILQVTSKNFTPK